MRQHARHLVAAFLLAGALACDHGGSTGPGSTMISVRARDDVGHSAGRNPILVVRSEATPVTSQTGADGTVDIEVAGAGTYRVTIIPRDGYFGGLDSLSKSVTVLAHARTTVEFTLYRAGSVPPEGGGGQ
jgi:hypothetical protein